MKTNSIVTVFNLLNSAKINKVSDSGKIKVVKAVRQMKSIATNFDELLNDARERLKGEEHDEMAEKASRWQMEGDSVDLTDEEKIAINAYFMEYGNRIDECIKEEAEKEHTLSFTRLTEEEFEGLISSNDWDIKTIMEIEEVMCDEE
jgi:hypothetical protein